MRSFKHIRYSLLFVLAACHPEHHYGAAADIGANEPSKPGPTFENVGTNPFVQTSDAPFSTFAVDVDTASYQYFMRTARSGQLPPAESVRTEDFVNYFSYAYPSPAGDDRLAISASAARGAFKRNTTLLRVSMAAPPREEAEARPANLVFLVDVSGSMASEDKLPLVQKTLLETLKILHPTDKVSIVTYAGDVRVRLEPTFVLEEHTIRNVINVLSSGGGTNGASGMMLAYEQAQKGFIEGGINHVLLCTDGDFNLGISSDEALMELIKEKRATGVTLTVVGYGSSNWQAAKMEKLSNAGNGVAAYLSDEDAAIAYVNSRLFSTFDHVASDAKVQLEFNPAQVAAYRLIGYENRLLADADFLKDEVDAGEIGKGHRVTALYELLFSGDERPALLDASKCSLKTQEGEMPAKEIAAGDWLLMKVRYKDSRDLTVVKEHRVTLSALPGNMSDADQDLRYAAAVAGLAEALKGSPFADKEGLDAIAHTIAEQAGRDADRAALAAVLPSLMDELRERLQTARMSCTYAELKLSTEAPSAR